MKPATFTLDIKGLELPDNVREEISLALNDTLMRKLGEVNLTGKSTEAAGGGTLFGKIIRIDGGELFRLKNRLEFGSIFQRGLENKLVLEAGFEKITARQFGG